MSVTTLQVIFLFGEFILNKYFNDDIQCFSCKRLIKNYDEICVACGAKNRQNKQSYLVLITFLLCLSFGYVGLHNLYLGNKIKIAFTFLLLSLFSFLLVVLLQKTNKTN
ncbi:MULTISPECIES: NINE protein [Borreliella]|uniref:TM2 domain-containing protein n=1 Tax=Borreliella burgdorferi TaxID=139 RepID=Q44706_BORBG|nr:NINE protein [Borreliella burgdorferi]AAA19034.1 unknown [Borreliella burgdorferi]